MSEILQGAIELLVAKYGGVRAAARALSIDPAYLSHLKSGSKSNPSERILRKLKLRRIVTITYLPMIKP